jgi:hypothetical protein
MKVRKCSLFGYLFVLSALLLSAGCAQSTPPPPLPVSTATPVIVSLATPQPVSTSIPAVVDNWGDRAIFRSGLIQSEQKALEQLPGASIYHLDVQLADDLASLQGQERVRYTNQEDKALDAIYFQLFPNQTGGKTNVTAVKVDGKEAQPVYEADQSTLKVPLPAPLQPGQPVVLQLDFKVEIPTSVGGSYGLFGYLDHILVLDGFYPAIPAYDERGWHAGKLPSNADSTYQDASFYVVRVTAPASLTLVASGVQAERAEKDNQQVVTFAAGPVRDFYMAASDRFTLISETTGETRVNSYAFKESVDGAKLALKTAVNAIKSFSARFGAYPYTEFDVVSTPMQGASGIEYPGMTGINYTMYDLKTMVSGNPAAAMLESTVAHEVGHQWFYNIIGNDQINEPWVDEAVTQYVTGLYFLDMYGTQGMESYRNSWLARWDRTERSKVPIGQPAGSYQGKEYSAIVYGRGPLFVEALAQKLGTAFDPFMRDYYQSYQWHIGTTAGFKQLAEKHCQCDLTPLFAEWVYPPASASPKPASAVQSPEELAKTLVAAKLAAMKAKNIDQYMALLQEGDPEYATEQRNWFLIYQNAVTSDWGIEVVKAEPVDANTLVASLYQHYLYGPEKAERRVTYEQKYVKTANGWKDADLNFKAKETAHFVIKYLAGTEAKVAEISAEAEKAYTSVVKELQIEPRGKVTLKLFADQEMLRENTDIRVAYLFSGWGEDGESIKMYAWRESEAMPRVIAHELVHKITLGISDSLTSWLAEGLAGYFGNQPVRGGNNPLQLGWFTATELGVPVSWLEETILIDLSDERTISLYYSASNMVVEFMMKTYGLERLKALLNELATYPRYDRGFDYGGMEQENQKRLHQAIEKVLGVNLDTFNQQWLKWIRSQKG